MKEVCKVDDLIDNNGVCVLIQKKQIALFYIDKKIYAIDNYDPIGKAYVLARGIIGDIDNKLVVASPLYKEHYDLKTGQCLEHLDINIDTYNTKIINNIVYVEV